MPPSSPWSPSSARLEKWLRGKLPPLSMMPVVGRLRRRMVASRQERGYERSLAMAAGVRPLDTREAIAPLRPARRTLSARPRVLGVGHRAWEKYGLWPSFERVADFDFIETGQTDDTWSERQRDEAGRRLLARIDELERQGRPTELVYMYCDSCFVSPAMLRELAARGIWSALMGLDDQHLFWPRRAYGMELGQSTIVPLVDVYWTTWKAGAGAVTALGGRPWVAAEGADPHWHHPVPAERDIDALFFGGRYGIRAELVGYLRKQGFNVAAYGAGWPDGFIPFEKAIELIGRSKVVLGVGNVSQMPGVMHLKGRDFEVPMCGAVYLTSFNPELADHFTVGRELLCYSSLQNCAEVLGWVLARPAEQQAIREAALARSLRDHTWEKRLQDLLALFRA
jgi:spore maturation protein CgeB